MIDTRNFGSSFINLLMASLNGTLESGLLINSENLQALRLIQSRYRNSIEVTYIDPPYNTPYSQILYKNDYKHSSWLSLISNCIPLVECLWADSFSFAIAIDDYEVINLSALLDTTLGHLQRSTVVVNHHPQGSGGRLSRTHEYLVLMSPSDAPGYFGAVKADDDEDRSFMRSGTAENNFRHGRWKSFYALLRDPKTGKIKDAEKPIPLGQAYPTGLTPEGLERIYPVNSRGEERVWRSSYETGKKRAENGELWVSARGAIYQSVEHSEKRETLSSNWIGPEFNAGVNGTKILNDMGLGGIFDYPKALGTMDTCMWAQGFGSKSFTVLDYFGGSGTTAHSVINLNRIDGGDRKFIIAEVGMHFESVLLPRVVKATFSPTWKDGLPARIATSEEADRSPRIIKVLRLESYEDTLNNLVNNRSTQQQTLLDAPAAQGADNLKEQYLLRYLLDVETRGSQSLLNVQAFSDPTAYKLKVKRPGSDESREVNVDLIETFNWLIGLSVQHLAAPQIFTAGFERDSEGRLQLRGSLQQDAAGPWWFRTVTGTTPDGRKALVLWRKTTGNAEQDNLVLDEWFRKHAYSTRDADFDLIYVNGGNNLPNVRLNDERWKVRLIEEDFHRLMFDTEGL